MIETQNQDRHAARHNLPDRDQSAIGRDALIIPQTYNGVAAVAHDSRLHAEGDAVAGAVVLEPDLLVLVRGDGEAVAPPVPIPGRCDEPPHLQRVAYGELRRVGAAEPLMGCAVDPCPRWPHDRDDRGLRCTEGDVDQQPSDLAARDRFEVFADGADVPVIEERLGRLDDLPRLTEELVEAPLRRLSVS